MGALKMFETPWLCPRLLSPIFSWAFVVIDPMNVCTKFKSVALPVNEIIWGTQENWAVLDSLGMPTLSKPPSQKNHMPMYRLFISVHSYSRDFRLQFWVGVANPHSWGREGRRGVGDGTVRRSIGEFLVTFPLSLRVSEILPLLFSSTPLFPTLPLVSSLCN